MEKNYQKKSQKFGKKHKLMNMHWVVNLGDNTYVRYHKTIK